MLAISYFTATTIVIAVIVPNINKLLTGGIIHAEIIKVEPFEYLSVWGGYDIGHELTIEHMELRNTIRIYRTERERIPASSFSPGDKLTVYLNEHNDLAFADRLLEFSAFRVLVLAILNTFLIGVIVTKLKSTSTWIWTSLVASSCLSLFAFLSYVYLWMDRDYRLYIYLFALCVATIAISLLLSIFQLSITDESLKESAAE